MMVRLKVVYDLGQNGSGLYSFEFAFQGLLEEIGKHSRSYPPW